MEIVKLLLITVLPAIVLGCIVGVAVGKHNVKKASGQVRAILTPRQRVVYSASILIGIACVLVGIFYNPGGDDMVDGGEFGDDMGMYDPGMVDGKGEPGYIDEPMIEEPMIDYGDDIPMGGDGEEPTEALPDEEGDVPEDLEEPDQEDAVEPPVAEPAPMPGGSVTIRPRSGTARAEAVIQVG